MNLTAITDFDEVLKKHFIDSLSMVKVMIPSNEKLIDIGTGAGFPGIPLKIMYPELDVILLDSLNKRITFLDEVINKLDLKYIKTLHGRAEDFGSDGSYRENFDICVSRAVAKLPVLSEYCLPFVKKGGFFISYKSGMIAEEVETSKRALNILGAEISRIENFTLPSSDIERTLVVMKKINSTPKKYPRSAGKPSRNPL